MLEGMNDICIDETPLTVRPIETTDIALLERAFTRLSRESVRFRFFSPINRLPRPAMLRLATVDHRRREALVALHEGEIVAVARYDAIDDIEAEIAVTVVDAWQHRGLGLALVTQLALLACSRGYRVFVANVLPDNRSALRLIHELVPDAHVRFVGGHYVARIRLRDVQLAA
jgi:RimJ/RimL family protein N-acetyltransferase